MERFMKRSDLFASFRQAEDNEKAVRVAKSSKQTINFIPVP
jgi:hypothetical protein